MLPASYGLSGVESLSLDLTHLDIFAIFFFFGARNFLAAFTKMSLSNTAVRQLLLVCTFTFNSQLFSHLQQRALLRTVAFPYQTSLGIFYLPDACYIFSPSTFYLTSVTTLMQISVTVQSKA